MCKKCYEDYCESFISSHDLLANLMPIGIPTIIYVELFANVCQCYG